MMNRDRTRSGKAISRLHALVNAEPERTRPGGRALMLMTIAVAAGVIVALAWLRQLPPGNLETLPDAVAQTTPTLVATVAVTEIAEAADEVLPSATEPAMAIAEDAVAAGRDARSGADVGNPFAQSVVAQQGTVSPPTSTPLPTPIPPLASIEAVAAIGGVEVWDGDTGLLVAQVPQGTLLTATAKSEDGTWIHVTLPDGIQGWANIEQVLVFDADRLASQPLLIIPITPTAPGSAPEAASQSDNEAASAATEELILRPTPVMGDGPTARVALEDSRLNLRAGPSSSYPIIAKAQPGELFTLLGRDATSQWLQLALPDVPGGFGWAATEFLSTDAVLADLPVEDAASDAPAYQEDPSGSAPRDGMAPSPVDREPPWAPDGEGAAPNSADSMILQPTPAPNRPPQQRHGPGGPGGPSVLSGKLAIQVSWGAEIYIYDLPNGDLRLLTGGFDPAISPDGQQVAFTRAGGEHGLYLINVDGSNERLIFTGRELLRSPKWSPDGQYIVFERGDEIIRCSPADADDPASACNPGPNLDTERQQKLARVDINGQNYQDIPVLERGRAPDWNSAGIVYQSPAGIQKTQDQPSAKSELVFFNIRKQYELDPDWQPNGGRIIFQRRENDHWEIYSVAADGSGLTALTFPSFTLVEQLPSNVSPAWSPDGKQIVYLSNRLPNQSAGDWNIWIMNADGSNQHPLPIDLPFNYTFVAEQMLDWGR
jgi:uncharacterized protein YraI